MKKTLNALIYLTIFFSPLYIIRGEAFGIPFTFLEVLILLTFFVWVIHKFREKEFTYLKSFFNRKLIIFLILFIVTSIVGVMVASDTQSALGIWKAYFFEPLLFFIVLIDSIRTSNERQGLLYSLAAVGALVSVVSIAQKITGTNIYAPNEAVQGRVTGFFNSANSLALLIKGSVPLV